MHVLECAPGAGTMRVWLAAVLAALALAGCAGNEECNGHPCVGSWKRDIALGGTVVRCPDGSWSHAGGLKDACAGHRKKR